MFTPFADHVATVSQSEDHKTICNIEDLKKIFPDSFNKISNKLGTFSIRLDTNTLQVHWRRCTAHIEAKKDIKIQLRGMTAHVIITAEVEPTP